MSLQTYVQAAPARAMNSGKAVIADASEYLYIYDIGLVTLVSGAPLHHLTL